MPKAEITSHFLNDSFSTSAENMAFDNTLLERIQSNANSRFFRFYNWQQAGITYSYNKTIPNNLKTIDNSTRVSGGGLVFHCPGDIVFCMIAPISDPIFPSRFKDKLCAITRLISELIENSLSIQLEKNTATYETNILFCNAYPNPYERYFNNEKVLAFAQRRLKQFFLVQGVIHCTATEKHFKNAEDYTQYFTKGLGYNINASILLNALKTKINNHCKTNTLLSTSQCL